MKPDKNAPTITAPADPAELEAAETAAALDALGAEITGTQDELSATQAAASAADFKSKAESWAFIPAMFGKILTVALPELAEVYTESACLNWGEAMVPVAEKYGWTDPAVSVEVTLIIATVPLALPTGLAIKKYLDERKQAGHQPKQAKQLPPQAAAPAADAPIDNNHSKPSASHVLPANLFAGSLSQATA